MFRKVLLSGLGALALTAVFSTDAMAGSRDSQGMPVFYLRGNFNGQNWQANEAYKFSRTGNVYTLTISSSNAINSGEFKIADDNWDIYNLGANVTVNSSQYVAGIFDGDNMKTNGLSDAVISFTYVEGSSGADIKFVIDGVEPPLDVVIEPEPTKSGIYVRGNFEDAFWTYDPRYEFSVSGNVYTLNITSSNPIPAGTEFKIADSDWQRYNYGGSYEGISVNSSQILTLTFEGKNLTMGKDMTDGTISFTLGYDQSIIPVSFSFNGETPSPAPVTGLSGTLPVLYINVYADDNGTVYDNEIISKDLSHKDYFDGVYWLDLNGCEWMAAEGAESIGSAEEPLKLQIKARGNYTRTGFSKKPFKLKLDKKASLLGLSKSKHFAILAHADDNFGYLRNFTGFNLGKRIGLPWTPSQQPVEVVINGDYRGLYFLTESIRVDEDRVNITELEDNVNTPALVSGGYIVELDNYDESDDAQIRMDEKYCAGGYHDKLRITFDTPEVYSDLQRRFVKDQFTAMNDAVGSANRSNDLWKYMDMDDAVRYYIVEEMISHTEAYHGSTYLFRDRGEGQKWHFSPLWDCGNAFNGPTNGFFYHNSYFGSTWIESIRENSAFNSRLRETWMWFMTNKYDGLISDIETYTDHIKEAAKADHQRWKNAPLPEYTGNNNPSPVVDNTDMSSRKYSVVNHITNKIEWLKQQFGDYGNRVYSEPSRDTTGAAPLPDYAKDTASVIETISAETIGTEAEYYNMQGMKVSKPVKGEVYIRISGAKADRVIIR